MAYGPQESRSQQKGLGRNRLTFPELSDVFGLKRNLTSMKVLLISANTETINMPVLPMGLALVAAATEQAGHAVVTLDLMSASDWRPVLLETFTGFSPEAIGISVRNIDDQNMQQPKFLLEPVREMVACIRELTDAPIVIGGAGYSIFPQKALDYLHADAGIQGEGEQVFPQLLQRFSEKKDIADLPGVYLPQRRPKSPAERIRHLDRLPMPRPGVHLPDLDSDARRNIWLPIQTRRGCPLNCTYCSTGTIEGRILRKYPVEKVVDTIARFSKAGFDRFFFVDNTFNLPPAYAKSICEAISRAGLNIAWRCIVYPFDVNAELVEKMAAAGCAEVSLGFESGSAEILKKLNKQFGPDDIRQAADLLKRHGIRRMGFLLLGGPGENRGTVLESLRFADTLGLEMMKVTIGIRIYPYTALARQAVAEGIIGSEDDLLFPKFYIAPGLAAWLRNTLAEWMKDRPNWIF
jgi:radical SAM superfamily enzyme YgiQ (UPF0313 family)